MIDLSSAPGRFVSPVDLGFQAVGDLGGAAEALDYTLLTRAWRDVLAERQGVGEAPNRPAGRNATAAAR